jgi:hypothetical protein
VAGQGVDACMRGDDIDRPLLHFGKDARHVFTNHAQSDQHQSVHEQDDDQ